MTGESRKTKIPGCSRQVISFLVIMFVYSWQCLWSQEANVWFFGDHAGITFNTSPPTLLNDNTAMYSENGTAILCDSNGDLILYTNGESIWNRDHEIIENGDGLYGSNNATQNALFIAAPDTPGLYYLFTQDRNPPFGTHGLCYSKISVFENQYSVLSKNVSVFAESTEKLTAVPHANGEDYWIISREYNTDKWHVYLLTAEGLSTTPVISATGVIQTYNSMIDLPVGAVKASPDGTLLATGYYDKEVFELYDFDDETGSISNARTSRQLYKGAYSVEFSPDGTRLYASTYFLTGGSNASYLFQFNLLSNQDLRIVAPVPSSADYPYRATALQLAPDGIIYVARYDGDSLGAIQTPNRLAPECNFSESYLSLGGHKCKAGLPNVLANHVRTPVITYNESCLGDTTWFTLTNQAFIDSLLWDFQDSGAVSRFSPEYYPWHIFQTADTFNINIAIYYHGILHKITRDIIIHPLPDPDMGEDFSLLKGSETVLDPGQDFISYRWNTGAQTSSITVSDSGQYIVEVTNNFGCYNRDTVHVSLTDFYCPNAFTPDGDGLNDLFRPAIPDAGFNEYKLLIYNRTGVKIFESPLPGIGWDGTYNGEPCPAGVYIYRIIADCKNCGDKTFYGRLTGSIMLLRH